MDEYAWFLRQCSGGVIATNSTAVIAFLSDDRHRKGTSIEIPERCDNGHSLTSATSLSHFGWSVALSEGQAAKRTASRGTAPEREVALGASLKINNGLLAINHGYTRS